MARVPKNIISCFCKKGLFATEKTFLEYNLSISQEYFTFANIINSNKYG